jgi:hypothetical protein
MMTPSILLCLLDSFILSYNQMKEKIREIVGFRENERRILCAKLFIIMLICFSEDMTVYQKYHLIF